MAEFNNSTERSETKPGLFTQICYELYESGNYNALKNFLTNHHILGNVIIQDHDMAEFNEAPPSNLKAKLDMIDQICLTLVSAGHYEALKDFLITNHIYDKRWMTKINQDVLLKISELEGISQEQVEARQALLNLIAHQMIKDEQSSDGDNYNMLKNVLYYYGAVELDVSATPLTWNEILNNYYIRQYHLTQTLLRFH